MQKIVVNRCYGGFGLSEEAYKYLGLKWDGCGYVFSEYDKRTYPKLVACVEALGEKANGRFAKLEVVKIPDGVDWEITNYDGWETIEEIHRRW